MKWLTILAWGSVLVFEPVSAGPLFAEEVSRTPPEIYGQKFAPLLTPLEDVLKLDDQTVSPDESGTVLLDEEIEYMEESGKRYLLKHEVYRARTEAGAKQIEEDVASYRKGKQRICLVLARTILPDGSRQEVRPNAAILQTPQREADKNIYQDREELRLIFPNVKAGSVTEFIILIEEDQFRLPGEFSSRVTWTRGWPLLRMRSFADLPDSYAKRLKLQSTGFGVPEAAVTEPEPGRKRYLWETRNVPAVKYEESGALIAETGPVIYMTTLPDWNAFAQWYDGELKKTGGLSPKLTALADEWTKGVKDPAAIQKILLEKVANDVRYTGLSFGDSDLRPHTCEEVWDNQYGDCKDKSNLLVSLLRYKGIDASLVLLNTDHSGTVEKRSPDFRDFDHAIVAIGKTPADFVFCDPTIGGCIPGMISPSSGDRDVLAIQDGKAVWTKTPPAPAGLLDYKFDLTLAPSGELSGWMTLRTSGYYGVTYNNLFRDLDKNESRSRVADIVDNFYPGAEAVDFEIHRNRAEGPPFELRVFFLVNVARQNDGLSAALAFPHDKNFFVDVGENVKRRTSFFQWTDQIRVDATVHLPPGWTPSPAPEPFQVQSNPFAAKARWEGTGDSCRAILDLSSRQAVIPAAQFDSFRKSSLALRAWLSKPLAVSASSQPQALASAKGPSLDDFPLMPTGDGQLELVDRRYPPNGNAELRILALQKILQLFPNDPVTRFTAQVKLAAMDLDMDKPKEAVQKISTALQACGKDIDAETTAWAEYLWGLACLDQKSDAEALKLFSRIAAQEKIRPYRRGWSCYQAGVLLKKEGRTAEAKLLLEQALALLEEAQPAAMAQLAEIDYASPEGSEAFAQRLQAYLSGQSTVKEDTIVELCRAARRGYFEKNDEQGKSLAALLDSEKIKSGLNREARDAVKKLLSGQTVITQSRQLQSELLEYLKKNPWASGTPATEGKPEKTALAKARDKAQKDLNPGEASQRALEMATLFPVDENFPQELWKTAVLLEWKDRLKPDPKDQAFFKVLIGLLAKLPHDNDYYVDSRFLQANYYKWRNQFEDERSQLLQIAAMPELTENFHASLYSKLGTNYGRGGKYPEALNQYKKLEPLLADSSSAADSVLHAVFINLELDRPDEALRIIGVLSQADRDTINKANGAYYIREFVGLASNPDQARAYWKLWPAWWPQWQACRIQAGLKESPAGELLYPEYPPQDIGQDLGNAVARKNGDAFWENAGLVAHGAKWLPSFRFELAGAVGTSPRLDPKLNSFQRMLAIALFENFPDLDPDLDRRARVQLAANYYDSRQPEKMAAVLRKFFIQNPDLSDESAQAMMRLQALLALDEGERVPESVQALEKVMAANVPMAQRGLNAYYLGLLYAKSGNPQKEKDLLEKELQRSEVASIPDQAAKLRDRLSQIGRSSDQSARFTGAVENWLQKNPLPWLQWTGPEKLESVKTASLAGLVESPGKQFTRAEQIKLQLLICRDKTQPYDLKTNAWDNTFDFLMASCPTHSEADAYVNTVLQDDSFPEPIRSDWLWYALCDAWKHPGTGACEAYSKNPLTRNWNPRQKKWMETWSAISPLDYSSPSAVKAELEKLAATEMEESALEGFRHIYGQLLDRGDLAGAEAAYNLSSGVQFASHLSLSPASFRMELLKPLKNLRLSLDLHRKLAEVVLKHFPPDQISKPAEYDNLRNRRLPEILDPQTALACILYEIKEGSYPREDFGIWDDFLDRLMDSTLAGKEKIVDEMAETALKNAPDDDWKAEAVRFYLGGIDTDDEAIWNRWKEQVKPFKDAEKWPQANARIRLAELGREVRLGQNVDFDSALSPLNEWIDSEDALELKLSQAWRNQDKKTMRSILGKMNAEELLHSQLLPRTLVALEWAGMKDEADLAREKARAELRKKISLSSLTLSRYFFWQSLNLSESIPNDSLIPQGWTSYSLSRLKNPRLLLGLQISEAKRSKDWQAMEKYSSQAVREFPTYYHFYWDHGIALMQNGKKKEARAALETYTRYSKNETEYPEALHLLKGLSDSP